MGSAFSPPGTSGSVRLTQRRSADVGKESIRVVKENPYRLADNIFGIGFLTADKIAGNLGIPKDSEIRAEAGILYVLRKLADNGDVYFPYEELIDEAMKILDIKTAIITSALGKIASEKRVVIEDSAVYLAELHAAEVEVAAALRAVLGARKSLLRLDRNTALTSVQEELKITLAEKQIQAISESLDKKVMVITGGPGTGKTTIINAIIRIYRRSRPRVLLAAPTGRAAKRMSEATGCEAKTIHRLLEFSPKDGGFEERTGEARCRPHHHRRGIDGGYGPDASSAQGSCSLSLFSISSCARPLTRSKDSQSLVLILECNYQNI